MAVQNTNDLWRIQVPVLFLDTHQESQCSSGGIILQEIVCLLNVAATRECISGSDLHRQFTCCHTQIEVTDPTFHLTQSQYTDTGPTSPSTDPIGPGAWQESNWSANFEVTSMTRPRKKSRLKRDSNPGSSALEADPLTSRPTRRSSRRETGTKTDTTWETDRQRQRLRLTTNEIRLRQKETDKETD